MIRFRHIAFITFALPTLALAQTGTPGVDQRQIIQQRRIDQGVASGSLTPREAMRLERGQQRVENMEARAKSDCLVTRQERAQLQHAENVQNRHITREKHDRQHDYNHNGRTDHPCRR